MKARFYSPTRNGMPCTVARLKDVTINEIRRATYIGESLQHVRAASLPTWKLWGVFSDKHPSLISAIITEAEIRNEETCGLQVYVVREQSSWRCRLYNAPMPRPTAAIPRTLRRVAFTAEMPAADLADAIRQLRVVDLELPIRDLTARGPWYEFKPDAIGNASAGGLYPYHCIVAPDAPSCGDTPYIRLAEGEQL